MGTGNSKAPLEDIIVNHPHFKNAKIIKYDDVLYMKTSILVESQRTVQKWEDSQKIANQFNKEYLLLPVDHKFAEQGFCGSSGVLNIIYDNYPIILSDEIMNRKNIQEYFQEVEVWYLLYILITCGTEFHEKKMKVGDIRPENIFINKDGQLKLANTLSWPREQNNYYKSLTEKQPTYLAPEELEQLEKSITEPETSIDKAESFSIGLTLLDAVLLGDSSKLYNYQTFTFNTKELQNLLGRFNAEKRYSQFLRNIIVDLLNLDPKVRKSPFEIYQRIQPYEESIKNLVEFSPNVPTQGGQRFSNIPDIVTTPFNDPRYSMNSNIPPYNLSPSQPPSESRYNYSSNLPVYLPPRTSLNFATNTNTSINYPSTSNYPATTPILPNYQSNYSSNSPLTHKYQPLPALSSNFTNVSPSNNSISYNSAIKNNPANLPYKTQNVSSNPYSYANFKADSSFQKTGEKINNSMSDYKSLNITDNTPLTFDNVDKMIERTRKIHP